jgi:peptidyl-prolyl cis-trans isomerase D
MLDIMRRKKRLKIILWLVIISLSLGMLLLFVPGGTGTGIAENNAATVNGVPIPMQDLATLYRRLVTVYSDRGKNKTDPETLKSLGLDRQAMNTLVGYRVMDYIAKQLGVDVTPGEIRLAVEHNPNLQYNGAFIGLEQYKALLAANSLTVSEFEDNQRMVLLSSKIRRVITDAIDIPEGDLREEFGKSNIEAQVDFVVLKKESFKLPSQPSEADLRAYFDANKEKYNIKEQRRAQYLLLYPGDIARTIEITDQEVQDQWKKEDKKETVTASHILFEVPKDATPAKEAEIKAKAEAVLKKAKAGEDFAKLAKEYSDDAGSKDQGGNLGAFARDSVIKEFADAAFSLKVGEISGLVRSQYGYHIIKVAGHDVPSLETSRKSIIQNLRLDKAFDIAKQKGAEAEKMAATQKDLQEIAKALKVPTRMQDTGFIERDSDPYASGISKELRDEIFGLKEIGAIGKSTYHPQGYALPKLLETKLPKPTDFNEVREKVLKDYVNMKESELMMASARELSRSASSLKDLAQAAKKEKWAVKTSKSFKMGAAPDPDLGINSAVEDAAFSLPVESVSDPIVLTKDEKVVVLQVKSRTPFDEAAYSKEKENIRKRLSEAAQDLYIEEYVRRVTQNLEKAGKIRINSKAFDQLGQYRIGS